MANQPKAAGSKAEPWRLTEALNAKLADVRDRGFEPQWIEASRDDLTLLIREGGEDAIRLDPDPAVDRAWFGDVEIRHNSDQPFTWVFVKGEVAAGDISAHVVEPPRG
ncbi:hypothetical protein [Phenylobacterium sp.]|jgi:hypothetical protein|uniref:hypothetical protein n=1 Tax=Phenylobacterium sp. TaxID=1871053 RepID=UPI002F42E9FD